jgi:hypothetical protein
MWPQLIPTHSDDWQMRRCATARDSAVGRQPRICRRTGLHRSRRRSIRHISWPPPLSHEYRPWAPATQKTQRGLGFRQADEKIFENLDQQRSARADYQPQRSSVSRLLRNTLFGFERFNQILSGGQSYAYRIGPLESANWWRLFHQGTPGLPPARRCRLWPGLLADERIDRVAETQAALLLFS